MTTSDTDAVLAEAPAARQTTESGSIRPFTCHAPQSELDDLRRRILAARLPEKETVSDFSPGREARDGPEARPLLGDAIRLAQGGGAAQRRAELPHRDRRSRHPFHPRALEARECLARPRLARLAGLHRRAAQAHRAAHQSDGAWWNCCRRLSRGDSVDAGLRLLGQADRDWLGARAHRACLGRAHEAARLHELCGAGRRLGCSRRRADGCAGAERIAGHPHQHAQRDSA